MDNKMKWYTVTIEDSVAYRVRAEDPEMAEDIARDWWEVRTPKTTVVSSCKYENEDIGDEACDGCGYFIPHRGCINYDKKLAEEEVKEDGTD